MRDATRSAIDGSGDLLWAITVDVPSDFGFLTRMPSRQIEITYPQRGLLFPLPPSPIPPKPRILDHPIRSSLLSSPFPYTKTQDPRPSNKILSCPFPLPPSPIPNPRTLDRPIRSCLPSLPFLFPLPSPLFPLPSCPFPLSPFFISTPRIPDRPINQTTNHHFLPSTEASVYPFLLTHKYHRLLEIESVRVNILL